MLGTCGLTFRLHPFRPESGIYGNSLGRAGEIVINSANSGLFGLMVTPKQVPKRNWAPTETSFRNLLNWLDQGVDSGGQEYLEVRRRMVRFFDRKNCHAADELADETLNRVARRLQEEGCITGVVPAQYCYIVGKFVLLEHLRHREQNNVALNEAGLAQYDPGKGLEPVQKDEELLASLDRCLEKLRAEDHDLILDYYGGEQQTKIARRKALAERLGLSTNALLIRACRIRSKLEDCMRNQDAN